VSGETERNKARIETLGLQPAVHNKKEPTTKKRKAAQEGKALSSRRIARVAVSSIPFIVQAMEVVKGDDEEEEEEEETEQEATFVAKRIVKTKYVKEGGVRVMKACVLWEDGVHEDGRQWKNGKVWEGVENVESDLQEMLDECVEKEAAEKRRQKK
jgi:hypothetical protein